MKRFRPSDFVAALLVSAGMWFFAFFVHTFYWAAVAELAFAALTISAFSGGIRNLIKLCGLYEFRIGLIYYSLAGLFLGFSLGMLYRLIYEMQLIPLNFTLAAFTAPAVGITEELVFRGFIQGTVTKTQGLKAIIFSSGSHTIYKVLIINTYPVDLGINLLNLALVTFSVGILVGWLRKRSGNIIPSALAHGGFDLMVYGSLKVLPVWVWG